MSLTSKPHINNWSTSFQLLSPSLRCCSSPLYYQSSTGDTVIVDLSLLRQEKVEQKCQCMATGYPDDIWWPWCVPWAGCVPICLHISYVHWSRINSTLPSGSRELSKRHSQFSKCAHRPKRSTGCKSQSGLMRVQYLNADPRWPIYFSSFEQNKHASRGLNSKALSLGGNMETMGKLEYSQNTRHSAWYLVTVDAFCQRWPPWQQKHSRANCVQRDFPSMAIPMSSTLAVSLHEHFSIMGWKVVYSGKCAQKRFGVQFRLNWI